MFEIRIRAKIHTALCHYHPPPTTHHPPPNARAPTTYPYRGTNSWNTKDTLGASLLFLCAGCVLLLGLSCWVICGGRPVGGLARTTSLFLYATTILYVLLVGTLLYTHPIAGVYAISAPVTLVTRTPHRMSPLTYFPEHTSFELAWPRLRAEYDHFLQRHPRATLPFTQDSFGRENAGIGKDLDRSANRGWRIVDLKLGDHTTSVCRHYFPTLTSLLEERPYIVSCVLSILDGKTRIPEHVGYSKHVLRYMLPLDVPKGDVRLCVNGETIRWIEGKSVLWDDTFPHMVFNHTSEPRAVLYMDVLRYKWTAPVFRTLMKHTSIIKDEIRRTETLVPV